MWPIDPISEETIASVWYPIDFIEETIGGEPPPPPATPLLDENNLSDLISADEALDNLGAGTAGKTIFTAETIQAIRAYLNIIDPPIPTVSTISGFSTIMDVSPNVENLYLTGGVNYGLWIDGPVYPFRGSDGVTKFTVAHCENYMFTVNSWNNGGGWLLSHVYDSPRLPAEGQYSNRIWLYGKYSMGDGRVFALGHHEWYQTMKTVDGIDGFNALPSNHRWVTGIKWMKSTDNGASWSPKAALDNTSMIIVPEPWVVQSRERLYGFFHPSNIVKEGEYYYAFVDHRSLPGGTDNQDAGFIMIRTDDLEKAAGWEYWTGSDWLVMVTGSYMGNLSPQTPPHMFFKVTGIPFFTDPGPTSMAQSIRFHTPSGRWMLFGSNKALPNYFCFCVSDTLANPQFEENGMRPVSLAGGGVSTDYVTISGRYISVFDPASTDRNFQDIGNTPICIVTQDAIRYRKQTLLIS